MPFNSQEKCDIIWQQKFSYCWLFSVLSESGHFLLWLVPKFTVEKGLESSTFSK